MLIPASTHKIVLATLNAKYIHCAFGLRYLFANMGNLQTESKIKEFTIHQRPVDIVEKILSENPEIVGLGIYIWNTVETQKVISILKNVAPEVTIIIGGPEVSYETDQQEIVHLADFVICGEADIQFQQLCQKILNKTPPTRKILPSLPVDVDVLVSPYFAYSSDDIEHRIIYIEASRGCPFRCEFCLSSMAKGVRQFNLDTFLQTLSDLGKRGVRHFKFVDRTFNLKIDITLKILQFFLDRVEEGYVAHFELIPDRLPIELREMIAAFPPATLQFEVGIQTFNPEIAKNISRRQNYQKLEDNFAFLRDETSVHVHADLIAGLPGEDLISFGKGFDKLVKLNPEEIQLGILKRLRGTPIIRHTEPHQLVFSRFPPYEILSTRDISFSEMQHMKRFARFWDLIGNSGNFVETLPILLGDSPFNSFMDFSNWLFRQTDATYKISLNRLVALVLNFLQHEQNQDPVHIAPILAKDYRRGGRTKIPKALHPWIDRSEWSTKGASRKSTRYFARQDRFVSGESTDESLVDRSVSGKK